ncbi:MAG TPA: NAD(P)H-binding protein [Caulobacterales bacterium]|nr:NAD(P)H-binding protein [Caulobacterales bacterium]
MAWSVTIVGIGSPVGAAIAEQFLARDCRVVGLYRTPASVRLETLARRGVDLRQADLTRPETLTQCFTNATLAVLAPPLNVSQNAIAALRDAGVERAIFFSSNNVAIDPDAPVYRELAKAEGRVRAALPNAIILRPTLIYGCPDLPTFARLCRAMARTPIFPVPGRGVFQPIFVTDLANVAVGLAEEYNSPGGVYAVGGPDVVSACALYRQISRAVGGARLLIPLPAPFVALAAGTMRAVGLRFPLDEHQIARLDHDRRALVQLPLPSELTPKTSLAQGLRALVDALADARKSRAP